MPGVWEGCALVSTLGKKHLPHLALLCMLQGCTFFDFTEPLTHLLNSHLMSPESVRRGTGFSTSRALRQHIHGEAESRIIWPGCRMPFCKWQRKSALANNPLPSLLFTWLRRVLLLGCRLQVQQHAKQPTFCFCQGTRLPTTENSQGPTGAVAKHKGNLVSKVNSMLFRVCLKFSAPPVPLLLDTGLTVQKALSNRHKDARPSLSQQTMAFMKCCCFWMLSEHVSVRILRNWVKVSPFSLSTSWRPREILDKGISSDACSESAPADWRTLDMLHVRSPPLLPDHTTTCWGKTHPRQKRLGSVLTFFMTCNITQCRRGIRGSLWRDNCA